MKAKGNSQRDLILDHTRASMLLRIFDLSYKMGVNDACQADDSGLVREHIETLKTPDKFGRIGSVADDWLYWQLTLRQAIITNPLYKSANSSFERYVASAGHAFRNYLGVAFSICKAFYMLGLSDWESHRLSDLSIFNSKPKVRLQADGKLKEWKTSDMISDAQIMCYEQRKLHTESDCKFRNTEKHFTLFIRCLALASMKRWDSIS